MRRHSLDPNSIRQQIKSVLTSPTRKLRHLTSNHSSNNGNGFINFGRRTRRFSFPEKKSSERYDINPELHPIQEVSQLVLLNHCYAFFLLNVLLLCLYVDKFASSIISLIFLNQTFIVMLFFFFLSLFFMKTSKMTPAAYEPWCILSVRRKKNKRKIPRPRMKVYFSSSSFFLLNFTELCLN